MRKFSTSLALAFLLACAGLANASTSSLTFSPTGTAAFSNSFASSTFDDFYTFSIPEATIGTVTATAVSGISFSFAPISVYDSVIFASISIFSGTPTSGTAVTSLSGFLNLLQPNFAAAAAATNLSPGNFYLEITGIATNGVTGNYAGNVNLFTTPVPEPGSYALLLAGLGLMGTIARRRSKTNTY